MKKLIAILALVAFLSTTALVGCGSTTTKSAATPTGGGGTTPPKTDK